MNHEKQQKKRGKSWISSLEGLSTPYNNFKVQQKLEYPPINGSMIFLAEVTLCIFAVTGTGDIPN